MTELQSRPPAASSNAAPRVPWWREPLLHFALLGVLLFVAYRVLSPAAPETRNREFEIEVPASVLAEAHEYLMRTLKRQPSERDLKPLIDRYVEDEILYREATLLGLHRDDPVLRAQLIDKMLAYSTSLMPPTQDQLRLHLEANRDKFERPERVAFEHVFFSQQRPTAELDARSAALSDSQGSKAVTADDFPFGSQFTARSRRELSSLFGEGFSARVFALEPARWSEPVLSRHGWHRVRLQSRVPAELPPLEEVQQLVLRDYDAARRQKAREQTLTRLRGKYRVRMASDQATAPVDSSGHSP